mmetsp:Transcript_17813/g.37582  ORF Transcript_17813/g.37582 Transcript_17813/m.37582 type:complete len:97 (-) Transcript_17813:16-306(-)
MVRQQTTTGMSIAQNHRGVILAGAVEERAVRIRRRSRTLPSVPLSICREGRELSRAPVVNSSAVRPMLAERIVRTQRQSPRLLERCYREFHLPHLL